MSDLIVKGAGEIKDGLYNIKDGKLFKYKANGGTVRTYPIIEAGWIPCSERLPLSEGKYLVTCSNIITSYIDVARWANNLHEVDEYDFPFNNDAGFYGYDSEYGYWELTNVIAWMPLPEAYKESDADGSD